MKKVILGGLLGGLVLFVWGVISHMALPLGEAGVRSMPASVEPAVLAAMKTAMNERAIYIFPGMDMSHSPSEAEQKAWQEKYNAGPAGIVVFNPAPQGNFGRWLGIEFVGNVLAALMAAIVILHVPGSVGFGKRALLVGLLGLLEGFDIDVSQWNWYSLPPKLRAPLHARYRSNPVDTARPPTRRAAPRWWCARAAATRTSPATTKASSCRRTSRVDDGHALRAPPRRSSSTPPRMRA
jgi:hypothetical protein